MEIKRDLYLDKLIARKHNGLIKVVTGIRRCGKSYLLNTLFYNHLIASGVPEDHIIKFAFDSADRLLLIGENLIKLEKSKKRVDYVEKAADILMKYRKAETPVGIVRNAGRKDESHCITTLGALKDADIDMFSVVIIGNSQTYEKNGRMITPRGYRL